MQDLILLHGAIGSSGQLKALEQQLTGDFIIHNLDLPGHGGKEMPDFFSIEYFADYVKNYCDQHGLKKVSIFGYSMGGYVAMYLAKQHPSMVHKIVTLASKFHWDEEIAKREVKMLQPEIILQKLPGFAKTLEQRHAPLHWEDVLVKSASMLIALGKKNVLKTGDYSSIHQQSLIMLGDRDKMVSLEETVAVYRALPNAQFSVLPGTPHPIESVNVENLSFMLRSFLL